MSCAIVTGSSGLIGSESVRALHALGLDVIGIDNDMRGYFLGEGSSTRPVSDRLQAECPGFRTHACDIRDAAAVRDLFRPYGRQTALVIHTAAQPSHDWAAREPFTDFGINANGTLNLLEAARHECPDTVFIHTSTNKVYGDTPNRLPLIEQATRWELDPAHPWHAHGIDETMSIDQCLHSLYGASKLSGDILVQEYGRYFGMKTALFRCGCVTGPQHAGAEAHGFLSYLMKCAASGTPYRVFGYGGKQVRDNIHSRDLVEAFLQVFRAPRVAEVYNMGGGRFSNCSIREAIALCETITGRAMMTSYVEENRLGDHQWWISDTGKFQRHYPGWTPIRDIEDILRELYSDAHS